MNDKLYVQSQLKLTIITSQNLIPQVPDKWKFDLVCLLEEQENLHTILTDALMEVGTIAVDSILSKVNQYPIQHFQPGVES